MGQRCSYWQACRRIYFYLIYSWRSGVYAVIHDATIIASWHGDCRNSYSESALNSTDKGGTPYGSSHVEADHLSNDEQALCQAQGKRLAQLALKLKQ